MTDWEQRVNRVLGMLNDAQAARRMAPDEYRARRRALLRDAALSGRGAAGASASAPAPACAAQRQRRRRVGSGWWKLLLWLACMSLGALAVYWYYWYYAIA